MRPRQPAATAAKVSGSMGMGRRQSHTCPSVSSSTTSSTRSGVGSALSSLQLPPTVPLGGMALWVHKDNRDLILPSCLRERTQIEVPIVLEEP